jgi:hypothetical protein
MTAIKQNRMALSFTKDQIECIEKHADLANIPPPYLIYSCIRIATELSSFYSQVGIDGNGLFKQAFYSHMDQAYKDAITPEQKEAHKLILVAIHNFFDYTDGLIKLGDFANEWKFVNKFK